MSYDTRSDLPYPDDIKINEKNAEEVKLLMPIYSGRDSETTSFLTYSYQHYILKPEYEKLSEMIEHISIVEMIHHDLLGTMIVQLGGTPIIGSNYNYWQGGYINYAKDVLNIINNNIVSEKKSIEDYKKILIRLSSDTVKEVVKRIISDEEIHLKAFESMLKQFLSKIT